MSDSMRKLAGQTAVYGVSTVLVRLLNYLLTPYLTRIMGLATYGVVTHLYALIPFVLVLLTMGLESGYFRFAGKAGTGKEKNDVFATAWGTVGVVSILFFVLVVLFNVPIADALGYADNTSYIWMTAAIVALDAITAIPFAKLREQGRSMTYVLVRLLSVVVNLALCFFFYGWLPSLAESGTLAWAYVSGTWPGYVLLSNLIASAVVFVVILPLVRGVTPRINGKLARNMLLYSLPLLVSGIAGTANEFIDRQMVLWLTPGDSEFVLGQLGIYGAALKLGVIMTLFTSMYRLAAEPFFLAEFKNDDFRKANAEAMKYFIIVSIFIFLFMALFVDFFALIVGRDFREGIPILPVILISNMLSGVVLNLSFWYKQTGATKFAIYVTGTGLLFTVLFNILLVPVFGYVGAAAARLICEFVMVVVSYLLNQRYYPVPYDLRRIGEYLLVGGAMYGISVLCLNFDPWIRYLIYLALVAIFAIYAVRREQIDVVRFAKSLVGRRR